MSVSLREVIEAGGYDLSKEDDMIWLTSKVQEFESLIVEVEDKLEKIQDKRLQEEEKELEAYEGQ